MFKKENQVKKNQNQLNPDISSLKIILIYLTMGLLWIFTTDKILELFIPEEDMSNLFQTIKGVFYVLLTGGIFYLIIKSSLKMYADTIKELKSAYVELDVGHRKSLNLEEKLFDLAYFDALTGLPNKIQIEEKIKNYIEKQKGEFIGLIYFDIDEFRNINEIKGHQIGDLLIKEVGLNLSKEIKEPNILARMGGDEFLIAIFDIEHLELLIPKIESLFKSVKKTYLLDNDEFFVTFSGGVTLYPDHGKDYITLFRHADAAMSIAKSKGKDQFVIFDEEMVDVVKQQTELLNQLRTAIINQEMSLHYQPVIHLDTHSVTGVEALIRWFHPEKGYIPPLEFISLSEKNGFIKDITEFVFQEANYHLFEWTHVIPNFRLSINLSASMLMHDLFIRDLFKWIENHQIDCSKYTIEITETSVISDIDKSIHVLKQLRRIGFSIALDDFGTGYSSLTYLQKLPIDIIKIDRSFIAGIKEDTEEFYVLKYMIDLAHHLKLIVVAEGIETEEQHQMIKKYGVDYAQGYFYCKPTTQDRVMDYIESLKKK